MSVVITRPGKHQVVLDNPVMPESGTFGYGDAYRNLINYGKLGALVTNPVTYAPRKPANAVQLVRQDASVLIHTGLPGPGLRAVVKTYRDLWASLPIPTILHIAATSVEDVQKSAEYLDSVDEVTAVELGLPDDISGPDAATFTAAATRHTEKSVLVRLPLNDAFHIAGHVADAGAAALVATAPPRGTARDPHTGTFVGGRVYGPTVKPLTLRMVGVLARQLDDVPIIGAGGIHTEQDARDYVEAGAVAVQVGSVTWVLPKMIELIARDLGGKVLTKQRGALADEWFPGMGETDVIQARRNRRAADEE